MKEDILNLIYIYFDQSKDIIFIFKIKDNSEEFYYANKSFYNNLGYDNEEIKNLRFKNLFDNIDISKKNEFIKNIKEKRFLNINTSILSKDNTSIPVILKVFLYQGEKSNYIISICENQIEKTIFEYRKYISEFLLKYFQKNNYQDDLILKISESIFVYFDAENLFFYPIEIRENKSSLYYMKDSALTVTSNESLIEPFIEMIENNMYLLRSKKEAVLVKDKKSVLIPINIDEKLYAIIIIESKKNIFFKEEIDLIRFTFQGIIIFMIKDLYLRELQYQKKCFNELLDYSLEMHYRQNMTSRNLEYISKSCESITGFTQEELINNPSLFFQRIHEEDKKDKKKFPDYHNVISQVENLKENENLIQHYYEYKFYHKDGSIRWLSDLFAIIFDNMKKPLYNVGSIRDITEQKRNEEYLKQIQNQIMQNEKMQALGRFSNEIAHDFNNILGSLKGNIQLSFGNIENIKKNCIAKENKVDLSELEINYKDALKIINKGLELTRRIKLFSQKKPLKTEVFDANESIINIKSILSYSQEKNLTIILHFAQEKIFIKMNKSQFDQVLLNLLVNAYDSIKDKGIVNIKTEIEKQPSFLKGLKPEEKLEYIKITINDNGSGISKDVLPHIFEPFFSTKGEKGTGVGLSIVYSIITQNNGYIEVDSKVGVGTSFFVYLPLFKK